MKTLRYFIILLFIVTVNMILSQSIARWSTAMGEIEVTLGEDRMPISTQNFLDLTNCNFYDNVIFHGVIADFMIQGG